MNYILILLLCLINWSTHAEEILPKGCTAMVVSEEWVKLPAKTSTVAMIHNLSKTDLWITHPVSSPSASAGWSSRLQAGNWSALALDNEPFELSCIESTPGHEQQTPCSDAVAICLWPTTSMPEGSTGTYWAAEDMPLSTLIAYMKRKGFMLSNQNKEP